MIPTDEIRSFRGVGWLNHQPIWMVQAVPSCAMSTILWVKVMNMVGAPKHVEKALEASERWMGATFWHFFKYIRGILTIIYFFA